MPFPSLFSGAPIHPRRARRPNPALAWCGTFGIDLATTFGPVLALTFGVGLAGTSAPADAQPLALPSHVRALVTGDPATPEFITLQLNAAIARAFAPLLPAGSSVRATAILPAPQPLERGFETTLRVSLKIDLAGDETPIDAVATLDVANVDLPGFAPETLAFRDDPEKIVADGVLSRTTVDADHPTRVYYYHQNVGGRRRFCVVLSANDSVRTQVHVVGAAAGPNADVMSTGHAVTKAFLTRKPHNEGSVVNIAGGRPYLERDAGVGPGEGVVGSVDLRVLDGGPVTVTVMAIPAAADPAAYLYSAKLPDDGHGRHGSFDLVGFAQWIVAYTAGGPDAAYVYGSRRRTPANQDTSDSGHDYGDYGVLQRITFDLANPTASPQTLFLYEKPLGGVVRSSFLVDGTLVDIGCVRVAQRYLIAPYYLAARSTAALDVVTMSDGGSNYPLEIGISATPPLPSAPGISEADGCFPKPAVPAK